VTTTLVTVVNVAFVAAIVVALAVVMSWPARLAPHLSAAASTTLSPAPEVTDVHPGPGFTQVRRAARPATVTANPRPARTTAKAGMRT